MSKLLRTAVFLLALGSLAQRIDSFLGLGMGEAHRVDPEISLRGDSVRGGDFSWEEAARNRGIYAAPAECYLLAYIAEKPWS